MKLELTNSEADFLLANIQRISQSVKTDGLRSYKLAKITRALKEELKEFHEARQEIISKHAELDGESIKRDEDGNIIWKDEGGANEEFEPIAKEKIEIEFKPLEESDFEKLDVSVNQAEILLRFTK